MMSTRLDRTAVLIVAILAVFAAAPAAFAEVEVPHGAAYSPSAAAAEPDVPHGVAYSPSAVDTEQPPAAGVRVVRVATNPGFDWGDAAIGAGATVALFAIGAGGGMLMGARRRRDQQPATAA